MKPYYQDDYVTLYCGDCRDVIASVDFDVVLTDPPYGNETPYGPGYEDSRENLRELIADVMPAMLAKAERVVVTPGNGNQYLYSEPTWTLAWVVPAGAGLSRWGFTCWQPILVYGADPYLATGRGGRPDIIIWTETSGFKDEHPCPKPEKFWRLLLQRVSIDPSEIIFDPFVGSGTTLRVAKDLGHKAIGVERNSAYCDLAIRRLAQEVLDLGQAA